MDIKLYNSSKDFRDAHLLEIYKQLLDPKNTVLQTIILLFGNEAEVSHARGVLNNMLKREKNETCLVTSPSRCMHTLKMRYNYLLQYENDRVVFIHPPDNYSNIRVVEFCPSLDTADCILFHGCRYKITDVLQRTCFIVLGAPLTTYPPLPVVSATKRDMAILALKQLRCVDYDFITGQVVWEVKSEHVQVPLTCVHQIRFCF